MFGKLSMILFVGLCACARPEYLSKESQAPGAHQKLELTGSPLAKLGLNASIQWTRVQNDETEEMGAFLLKFWRPNLADQSPILQDPPSEWKLAIELVMPSMGHGTSPVRVQKMDIGTYLVEDVFFSMPGEWDVKIQFLNEAGAKIDETSILVHY